MNRATNNTTRAKFAVMVDTRNCVGQPFCHWATSDTRYGASKILNRLAFSGQVIRVPPMSSVVKYWIKGY